MATKKVANGNTVKVDYTGTFDDGKVFDSSEGKEPLSFEVGSHQVIKGFEDAVLGMAVGEEKKIVIPPEDAYGNHNPELIKKVPKEFLPKDQEITAGMMLGVGLPNGQRIPATIIAVSEKDITIDLNHALAGKTLHFKIAVIAIS